MYFIINLKLYFLTLYDPGGGGFKSPSLRFFALTHLILEMHYCALVTFPKKMWQKKIFDWGS